MYDLLPPKSTPCASLGHNTHGHPVIESHHLLQGGVQLHSYKKEGIQLGIWVKVFNLSPHSAFETISI